MKSSRGLYADLDALLASAADVRIVTSDGQTIAAHSSVLASASPVLEAMIQKARRGWGSSDCTIRIPGASADAVLAFLHFLYANRVAPGEEEEEAVLGAHAAPLLALAHAYRVPWLKRAAETAACARLTADRAVDMLKLAGLCDAPRLRLRCARMAGKDFPGVERSDGYRFARRHDPALELDLLRTLEDADQRKARWDRERAAQEACRRLGDAMDALDRIFVIAGEKPCAELEEDEEACACRGLRMLMRHLAACKRKAAAPGGCKRCKRMMQLFRLHASVCDRPEQEEKPCRVPLCRHFKSKMETEKADKTWRLLVKKVVRARAMASFANRAKLPVPEVVAVSWARFNSSVSCRWTKMR
ncbi:hypothetical protein PR202_ga19915 [Eleusine coracana subsp. coracana]|uniref:BTB domain-containing protein n=1 Tax=Eleusine coracana subsp. coracana TaxID=191504 RepID=A0AAV5CWU6_ELECO|nr:hypothetical protein QOZ80_4AG0313270 [Eleusine coracana subsp. coracana]GJN02553.1 hypothetical protein PR202_ga19915 [Eleusine coracana subsp. coracana]